MISMRHDVYNLIAMRRRRRGPPPLKCPNFFAMGSSKPSRWLPPQNLRAIRSIGPQAIRHGILRGVSNQRSWSSIATCELGRFINTLCVRTTTHLSCSWIFFCFYLVLTSIAWNIDNMFSHRHVTPRSIIRILGEYDFLQSYYLL